MGEGMRKTKRELWVLIVYLNLIIRLRFIGKNEEKRGKEYGSGRLFGRYLWTYI